MLTSWTESSARAPIAAVNPPKSDAASGLVHSALGGDDEDGEDEGEDEIGADLKSGREPHNSKLTWSRGTLEANLRKQEEKEE